jgi:aminoglycoside phosphotransferase (APT) family kinase protein
MRAVEEQVADYLASKLGVASVEVSNMLRIYGGASRETWMLLACYERDGKAHEEELVLRKDPPASLLETDRELEFAFYSAFFDTAVPVPRMRWLENDPSVLGGPFFVMDRILGCDTSTGRILEAEYDSVREQIGRRHYEILADIHDLDWRDTPIAEVVQPLEPHDCWLRELNHWEAIVNREELVPQPITRAAIHHRHRSA